MVCTDLLVRYRATIDLANADLEALAAALKMMDGVLSATIVGNSIVVKTAQGSTQFTVDKSRLDVWGPDAQTLKDRVKQYYMATVQAAKLKKEGYQATVEKAGERLRVRATR